MQLHNTLSKKVEKVKPLEDRTIGVYTCGPTVYDHVHIGNLAAFIFADTLRRALKANGFKVRHVMNFTDVDDKTIKRSREKYARLPPEEALKKLTDEYSKVFMEDMSAVGNDLSAYKFVKATDYIEDMQELIVELYKKNIAYVADDGIYFSIEAYRKAGKTYGQLADVTVASTSLARIQNDEYDKESAQDFALWKKQKPDEPAWDFTLDKHIIPGRPGWHIECSVMSTSSLGQPFDIHTGGVDLIFPHHENEIAQSTAAKSSKKYANYFMHSEHILVDGNKMSKSLNNFYTIDDLRGKGFEPLAFRLLTLQSHYRSRVHFSWENLQAAQNRLDDLRAMAALRWQPRKVSHDYGTFALRDIAPRLVEILADDLDTPQALAFLSRITAQLLTVHIEEDMVDHFDALLAGLDDLFGLNLQSVTDITAEQKAKIKEREHLRQKDQWQEADKLRAELAAQGVGIQDHQHGPTWYPCRPS